MKKRQMAWMAGAVLAAWLCAGCAALTSPEAQEQLAAGARKAVGTEGLAERLAALEEQGRLTYAFTWLTAEKAGITETAARDFLAGKTAPDAEEEAPPAEDADAIDFTRLEWKFGGVDGSRAALSTPRLSGLKAGAKSLSYTWEEGLGGWGLARDDAGALACFFVEREDGSVVGGKFDWVSTSRSSRGLENVFDGYAGWSLSGVPNPCKCWFVVITKDGRKRSNVAGAEWKR